MVGGERGWGCGGGWGGVSVSANTGQSERRGGSTHVHKCVYVLAPTIDGDGNVCK